MEGAKIKKISFSKMKFIYHCYFRLPHSNIILQVIQVSKKLKKMKIKSLTMLHDKSLTLDAKVKVLIVDRCFFFVVFYHFTSFSSRSFMCTKFRGKINQKLRIKERNLSNYAQSSSCVHNPTGIFQRERQIPLLFHFSSSMQRKLRENTIQFCSTNTLFNCFVNYQYLRLFKCKYVSSNEKLFFIRRWTEPTTKYIKEKKSLQRKKIRGNQIPLNQ